MFGVAPAPTTIFTFGMLLMLEGGAPLYLAVIPLLWSLAGGSAAVFILRIPEDWPLLVAGIARLRPAGLEAPAAIASVCRLASRGLKLQPLARGDQAARGCIDNMLVGAGRFELPTPCSRSKCATRLRYAPPDR